MVRFKDGQRVLVKAVGQYERIEIPPTLGTVRRLRRADVGAWVELDSMPDDNLRSFPADDAGGRGNHVLAYPEDCEAKP